MHYICHDCGEALSQKPSGKFIHQCVWIQVTAPIGKIGNRLPQKEKALWLSVRKITILVPIQSIKNLSRISFKR